MLHRCVPRTKCTSAAVAMCSLRYRDATQVRPTYEVHFCCRRNVLLALPRCQTGASHVRSALLLPSQCAPCATAMLHRCVTPTMRTSAAVAMCSLRYRDAPQVRHTDDALFSCCRNVLIALPRRCSRPHALSNESLSRRAFLRCSTASICPCRPSLVLHFPLWRHRPPHLASNGCMFPGPSPHQVLR